MRHYLAPLSRCLSLIKSHIPKEDLVPQGRFCTAYANITQTVALIYLGAGMIEEANKYFYASVEFQASKEGINWPSCETSLDLLYGLAVTCHRSGDMEKSLEALQSALSLSEKLLGDTDEKTLSIVSLIKNISERQEVMLAHHKSVVLASVHSSRDLGPSKAVQESTQDELYRETETQETDTENMPDYGIELLGAAFHGDYSVVKLLLGIPGVDADVQDELGRTPLWMAT
ncbi:hypothetical protein F5884DRAFT_507343 [Xylogone sp. PMI_703]|nr:hypothetical protein F5884DRAFT_507343 [Xylogone sp. PMI_703]